MPAPTAEQRASNLERLDRDLYDLIDAGILSRFERWAEPHRSGNGSDVDMIRLEFPDNRQLTCSYGSARMFLRGFYLGQKHPRPAAPERVAQLASAVNGRRS